MNRVIVLLSFLLISSIIWAQTTLEEYNYVTKGYQIKLESGLDMKKGYSLTDVSKASTIVNSRDTGSGAQRRLVTIKSLNRIQGNSTQIAAYMIIYEKVGNPKEYLCLPSPNSSSEIINLYAQALYSGEIDSSYRLQVICMALGKILHW